MDQKCIQEILELHRFIEGWFKGDIEKENRNFARLERALADDFLIVHPTGIIEGKTKVLQYFRSAHGAKGTHFAIEIRNVTARRLDDSARMVCYEEWHFGEETKDRLSTALFRLRPDDGGIERVHVHETLLAVSG